MDALEAPGTRTDCYASQLEPTGRAKCDPVDNAALSCVTSERFQRKRIGLVENATCDTPVSTKNAREVIHNLVAVAAAGAIQITVNVFRAEDAHAMRASLHG